MKKTFTLLIALLALCVSSWATQITWEQADVQSVNVSCNGEYYYGPDSKAVNGISVTAYTPNSGSNSDYSSFSYNNYSEPYFSSINVGGNGTLTFSSVGNITSIVIHTDENGYGSATGWNWSNEQHTLTWTGNAASVVMTDASVSNITSIDFTVSVPSSLSWDQATVQSINVSCNGENYYGPDSKAVNGISVTANTPNSGSNSDYSSFSYNNYSEPYFSSINVGGNGTLTFSSVNMTSIVIHTDENGYGSATGWNWSNEQHTLTWTGNAASVVMADASVSNITSIDFTFASNDPEPAPASTTITWNQTTVNEISLDCQNQDEVRSTADIDGITASLTRTSIGGSSCYFKGREVWITGNGELTFTSSVGDISGIIITYDYISYDPESLPAGWTHDGVAKTFTWAGTPSSAVTISGNIDFNPTSIVFTVSSATPTPTPTPAGPSFIWAERQVSHVDLQSLSESETKTTPVIKNIIASLKRTDAYGQCKFTDKELYINSCGKLTFKSIVGELTGITITCDPYNDVWNSDIQPSAEWTYDSEAKTFTWTGTPSDEVTISGNVDFLISSIEFFYTPAAAPRKGQQFMGDYNQIYEITGAQTAKLPAQTIDHTLNIPASVEYYGDIYYVTEIDDYAFYHNEDLPNIMGGENIAKIGAQAFNGCLRMDEANIESAVLDTIGDAAFINCKLLLSFMCETEFPPVLGSSVFTNDNYLNHIRVFTPTDYQTTAGWNWYADKIGDMYPTPAIGEQFFWHNQMTCNLYEVSSTSPREAKVLPYNATVNAIYPITRTGTLVIPEMADYMNFSYNITGIGANAYKDSTRFNIVVMPLAMKSIESGAFLNCTGVEKVYFLWDDPTTVTWADANVGDEFKTATGGTKIFVPKGKLEAYQTWAPAWRDCMIEGDVVDAVATEDPDDHARYFRTFYDSSTDYMMPAGVWAHAGYVEGGSFMLSPVAFDGQILPRGTAVVLESDTREYRLIPMGNDAPLYDGRNELVGTDENIEVSTLGDNSDKVYVLNTQATIGGDLHVGMGMYKYTGTTLGAHKAYLIYDAPAGPNSAPARFVFKHEQNTTDIENVQSDKVQCTKVIRDGQLIIIKDGKEYNAQGQKLR